MPELGLFRAAGEIESFEEPAFISGGSQVSLGPALAAHSNAGSFRKLRASRTIRNYKLSNVVLDADNLVLLKDGRVVPETCYFVPDDRSGQISVKPDAASALPDRRYIMACNLRQHHYGHWMMQCLPAIDWSLRHNRENACLVIRELEPWQEDTLALLGHSSVHKFTPTAGRQYHLPSIEYSEFLNGSAAHSLSLSVVSTGRRLASAVAPEHSSYRMLYMPVSEPFYGRITNEGELIRLLIDHGVHVFSPCSLTVSERVNLLRQADVVIAPHGDDLADIMFCKPATIVWELMPRHYENACYNRLAQSAGLDYWGDMFEPVDPKKPHDWIVDLNLVSCRLQELEERRSHPQPVRPMKITSFGDTLTAFESLGDNCEFGLVQRKAGVEPLGLLRFTSFQVPPERRLEQLVDALDRGFAGLGEAGNILISAEGRNREFMVRETRYGLLYHTFRHEREASIEAMRESEPKRLGFLRRKLLDDLASAEKIWVWRSQATVTIAEIIPLLDALRRYGPNRLLWVVEADDDHQAGTFELLRDGLLRGFITRLAPGEDATNTDENSWFELCQAVYIFYRGGVSELVSHEGTRGSSNVPTQAARNRLAGGLRSWVKGTVQPSTTPEELRSKGQHFLGEAAKAEGAEVISQMRALAYIHFEAADLVRQRQMADLMKTSSTT